MFVFSRIIWFCLLGLAACTGEGQGDRQSSVDAVDDSSSERSVLDSDTDANDENRGSRDHDTRDTANDEPLVDEDYDSESAADSATGTAEDLDTDSATDLNPLLDGGPAVDSDSEVDSETSEWVVAFEDEFDGETLDLTKWKYNYPWGSGHVHNHRAWCVEENVSVENGLLRIKGENKKHPDAIAQGKDGDYDFTSGVITTHGKFQTRYGLIEGRFKGPGVRGSWPAFWTLQDGWPPEIDILEMPYSDVGSGYGKTDHHYYLHYTPAGGGESSFGGYHSGPDKSQDFHTYSVLWTPSHMIFFFDDQRVADQHRPFEIEQCKEMYLLINLAIGGWGGEPSTNPADYPYYYEADWVRVLKPRFKVVGGDFEKSYHSPWATDGNWAGVAFDTTNPYRGLQALQMDDNRLFQIVALEPDSKYRLEFAARIDPGAQMEVSLSDLGAFDRSFPITDTEWQFFTYDVETGSTEAECQIAVQTIGRGFLDAVRFYEK